MVIIVCKGEGVSLLCVFLACSCCGYVLSGLLGKPTRIFVGFPTHLLTDCSGSGKGGGMKLNHIWHHSHILNQASHTQIN